MIDPRGVYVGHSGYRVRFSPVEGGAKTATRRWVRGAAAAGVGDTGDVLIEAAPVSLGRTPRVTEVGEHRLFAGWRSDPFFFDVLGVLDGFKFTHQDFFADKDACSIVLEIPNVSLAPGRVGIWARTLDGAGGRWVQADRRARPAQTPFLTGEASAADSAAQPADDRQFVSVFTHSLEHSCGYAPADAERVAATLLPDRLP